MANEAYKVLQDTSLPRALFEIGETANGDKLYETEGRAYIEGSYVLAEDITPPLRQRAEDGELEHLLEPVSREEALEAINQSQHGVFAAEHGVEHEALVRAGHKVVDRKTVLELRSEGAEDAKQRQKEAKANGADERPNLSFENTPDLAAISRGDASPTDEDSSPRLADAEESYADADEAREAEVQVTPSGLVAGNVNLTDEEREEDSEKPSRPRRKPRSQAAERDKNKPENESQGS